MKAGIRIACYKDTTSADITNLCNNHKFPIQAHTVSFSVTGSMQMGPAPLNSTRKENKLNQGARHWTVRTRRITLALGMTLTATDSPLREPLLTLAAQV
jgi:hypothetical protein